ncbi:transposase [Actinopolyspora biskrensis]|uniref:transposase n=1 Tax=Actinopolyspora biskrensis TaxID=1470178 RepID=UPI0015CE1F11
MAEWARTAEDSDGRVTLIDGVLVPTGNHRDQERPYPGKRRCHGVRPHVATDARGTVLARSELFPGTTHDLTVFRRSSVRETLNHAYTIGALGYLGSSITHPHEIPEGRPLTPTEKKSIPPPLYCVIPSKA